MGDDSTVSAVIGLRSGLGPSSYFSLPRDNDKIKEFVENHCDDIVSFQFGKYSHVSSVEFLPWDLPEWVKQCISVKELECTGLELPFLPEWIGNLTNLVRLTFRVASDSLPDSLATCCEMEELKISGFGLESVPASILSMKKLKRILITDTSITEVPEWIGEFYHLMSLNVQCNHALKTIPATIGKLGRLLFLDFHDTAVEEIPDEIGCCAALQDIHFDGTLVRKLPELIGFCEDLQAITCSNVYPDTFPDDIEQCTNITYLWISKPTILHPIPRSRFPNLKTLVISKSPCLREVPEWVCEFDSLNTLTVELNPCLTTVPQSIGKLGWLWYLNLAGNKIGTVPDSIGECTSLLEIDVSSNEMKSLPDSMTKCTSLRIVKFGGNFFNEISLPGFVKVTDGIFERRRAAWILVKGISQ